MNEEDARTYGRYARDLIELAREGNYDALALFLQTMTEDNLRELLTLIIDAEGRR